MFDNLGWPEILALLLVALFVIGPERLPKMLSDVGGFIRKIRRMASSATADLNKDLGTNLDITDLNPKTFIRKHVLSEEDEAALKRPLQAAFDDLKKDTEGVRSSLRDTASSITEKPSAGAGAKSVNGNSAAVEKPRPRFDTDAT